MQKVNYIQHLNKVCALFYQDDRLNPTHISVYLALFQFWNLARFRSPFSIARTELMTLAKIKSKNTYSKCLKDLNNWDYIEYNPSYNPYQASSFNLHKNWESIDPLKGPVLTDTSPKNGLVLNDTVSKNELALTDTGSNNGLVLIPYNKHSKQKNLNSKPINLNENQVVNFFTENNFSKKEGQLFYNHYQANGWKTGSGIPIENWQAAANKWMLLSKEKNEREHAQNLGMSSDQKNKRYDEPL